MVTEVQPKTPEQEYQERLDRIASNIKLLPEEIKDVEYRAAIAAKDSIMRIASLDGADYLAAMLTFKTDQATLTSSLQAAVRNIRAKVVLERLLSREAVEVATQMVVGQALTDHLRSAIANAFDGVAGTVRLTVVYIPATDTKDADFQTSCKLEEAKQLPTAGGSPVKPATGTKSIPRYSISVDGVDYPGMTPAIKALYPGASAKNVEAGAKWFRGKGHTVVVTPLG